jgi:hypothetical protein
VRARSRDGVLVGSAPFVPPDISVFGRDGTLRYRFELQSSQRFDVFWRYGYVCSGGASLSRIVEPASGATVRQVQAQSLNGPACVTLLYVRSSDEQLSAH